MLNADQSYIWEKRYKLENESTVIMRVESLQEITWHSPFTGLTTFGNRLILREPSLTNEHPSPRKSRSFVVLLSCLPLNMPFYHGNHTTTFRSAFSAKKAIWAI